MIKSLGNFGFLQQGIMKDAPVTLLDLGVEKRTETSYFFDNANRPPHFGYVLQYTLGGSGIYELQGKRYLLKEGDGFFLRIPEDSRYYLPESAENTGWEFFYLHFDGNAVLPFYQSVRKIAGAIFSIPTNCALIQYFFWFYHNCHMGNAFDLYQSGEFLYCFLSRLLRTLETPSPDRSPLLQKAQSYMKENYDQILCIRDVADYCGISHEHLSRRYKQETGQTMIQYLTLIRLTHAVNLLLNSHESIDSIARKCGFDNGNYFAKVFRRHLDCSPAEYRRLKLEYIP